MNTVFLMYHELEAAGRSLRQQDGGYLRYVNTESDFRRQLQIIRDAGFTGLSVSEALDRNWTGKAVAMTFDDGNETDLTVAAPLLRDFGFNATFYVVAGIVGRRGCLSEAQIVELVQTGFEIGCHSMNHRYLPDLSDDELKVEIVQAKARLEGVIGRSVDHFSCPGGRWSARVALACREAGYRSMATSRTSVNTAAADCFALARIAIRRGTRPRDFDRWIRGEGLRTHKAKESLFAAAKRLLGPTTYEKLRLRLLDKRDN